MDNSKLLKYKGKPMVRKKNEIYYGNLDDKYVVLLKILSSQKVGDTDVADKVSVELLLTDDSIPASKRVVKKSEKAGLYTALDVGAVWLDRALKGKLQ